MAEEAKEKGITVEKYIYNMKSKYLNLEPSDEKFLKKSFKKRGIKHAKDEGFIEIHKFMTEKLENRKILSNVA